MTFLYIMGGLITTFVTIAYQFLKKGGVYNREMPSTDNIVDLNVKTDPDKTATIAPNASILPQDATSQKTQEVLPLVSPKPNNALVTFCTAIRDFEGFPGDRNYRNNNPGNCRCSPVGYLPKYGVVKCVDNFAVFQTYELGWEYLLNLVQHRAELHPNWTILDFFSNYAPSSDGNYPLKYASNVAKKCGVIPSCSLRELFS